ncbi:MAG: YggT family protein [Gallionella sp.]
MAQIMLFLLDVLLLPLAGVVLFRFHAVWMGVPMRNTIGEFVMALTNFMVLPLRRKLPAMGKFDLSSFLVATALIGCYLLLSLWLKGYPFVIFPLQALLLWTIMELATLSLYLLMAALLIQAILSWTNPYSPLQSFLSTLTYRFVSPIRRIIPLVGNVDLAPLVVILLCQLLLIVPLGPLERQIMQML